MRGVCGSRSHWLATVSALALLLGRAPAQAQTAPAAPSGLTASAASSSQVNLTWTDHSHNEFAFAVWRQGGGADWARVGVVGPNATAYTDITASAGVSYNYRVRAINAVGASDWSNVVSVTTPSRPAAPTGLATTAVSGSQVTLAWIDN